MQTDSVVRLLLVGRAGAGKDTIANYLAKEYGFMPYSFAEKLKLICRDLFPDVFPDAFSGIKPRALLQNVGEYMRREDPDVWVYYLLRNVEKDSPSRAVITDCRYRNELEICAAAGFIPVRVDCPDDIRAERLTARGDRPLTAEEERHPSENEAFAVLTEQPCKVIDNSGTFNHLYRQVDDLMRKLGTFPMSISQERPSWQETFVN